MDFYGKRRKRKNEDMRKREEGGRETDPLGRNGVRAPRDLDEDKGDSRNVGAASACRTMRGWRGGSQDAQILSVRRHRQHGLQDGEQRGR